MEGQQFLVLDKDWDWTGSADDLWNEQALLRHLGVASRGMVVMTASETATSVPVTILIGGSRPKESELDVWDHIVEVSLRCESGALQIGEGQAEDALIALPTPGDYRVRVSMANLDSADDVNPSDHYAITLWRHRKEESCVVKWWEPWRPPPPPRPRENRRTIYGIDNYRRALKEMGLTTIATRETDPAPEVREFLPSTYKESLMLLQADDGTYWEYSTEAPHRIPLLTELAAPEAQKLYSLK